MMGACTLAAYVVLFSVLSCSALPSECCDSAIRDSLKEQSSFGFAIGNEDGPCCVIEGGLSPSDVIHIWSASKWVTGYIILRLIDQGKLTLNTRASDVLDYWTKDAGDERSGVTVRHLLSQTDGLSQFRIGNLFIPSWGVEFIGMCPEWNTVACAEHAYTHLFQAAPGEKFHYSETSFYVLGAIAMKLTGHSEYDGVFQELIAGPLGMIGCAFNRAVITVDKRKADPGGGMKCSINEYGKFLRAVYARELVSDELHEEAEMVQTSSASNMPEESRWAGDGKQHYSLAHWIQQFDDDGVLMHSMGADGFFPWVWRQGRRSHWGIIAPPPGINLGATAFPNGIGIRHSSDVFKSVFPLVRLIMRDFNPTTTTTTSAEPSGSASWFSYSTSSMQAAIALPITVASVLLIG